MVFPNLLSSKPPALYFTYCSFNHLYTVRFKSPVHRTGKKLDWDQTGPEKPDFQLQFNHSMLYTIFYNSFYVPNITKVPVLIGFYSLWQKLKKTGSTSCGPGFLTFPNYATSCGCPLPIFGSKNWTGLDLVFKGLVRSSPVFWPQKWATGNRNRLLTKLGLNRTEKNWSKPVFFCFSHNK